MPPATPTSSTDLEHERLIRQATHLAPFTERFFRDAGIGPGQRVLDLGSGAGDVAMLAARLVGPAGEVVGIERDTMTIALARTRAAAAGFRNVTFTQSDVGNIEAGEPFDAVVGRLILAYLPDPVAVMRKLFRLVRLGGVLAIQDMWLAPALALNAHLPVWCAGLSLVLETLRRSGVHVDLGAALYRMFQEAGLPAPRVRIDVPVHTDSRFMYDALVSLLPEIERLNLSLQSLGDFSTLLKRLQEEAAASKGVVAWVGLVGAFARTRPTQNTASKPRGGPMKRRGANSWSAP